jgi:hypothetical protein
MLAVSRSPAVPPLVATGSTDATVRVWLADDLAAAAGTPRAPHMTLRHDAAVKAVHFTRNGRYLVTAALDSRVRVFCLLTGALVALVTLPAPAEAVFVESLSDDDLLLAALRHKDAPSDAALLRMGLRVASQSAAPTIMHTSRVSTFGAPVELDLAVDAAKDAPGAPRAPSPSHGSRVPDAVLYSRLPRALARMSPACVRLACRLWLTVAKAVVVVDVYDPRDLRSQQAAACADTLALHDRLERARRVQASIARFHRLRADDDDGEGSSRESEALLLRDDDDAEDSPLMRYRPDHGTIYRRTAKPRDASPGTPADASVAASVVEDFALQPLMELDEPASAPAEEPAPAAPPTNPSPPPRAPREQLLRARGALLVRQATATLPRGVARLNALARTVPAGVSLPQSEQHVLRNQLLPHAQGRFLARPDVASPLRYAGAAAVGPGTTASYLPMSPPRPAPRPQPDSPAAPTAITLTDAHLAPRRR